MGKRSRSNVFLIQSHSYFENNGKLYPKQLGETP